MRLLISLFLVAAAVALLRGGEEKADSAEFTLKPIPVEKAAAGEELPADRPAAVPADVPEAFRKLLDPAGLRLYSRKGKALYDIWFRKELPLVAADSVPLGVRFGRIAVGSFVGVVRSYGQEFDYKDNPIDPGFFCLRYGIQPEDGDHLGTAESRDFLMLTGFKEDKTPDAIADMERLNELSIAVSITDHPMVLYLIVPEGEVTAQPRLYQHSERDEWIVDTTLKGRVGDAEESTSLRIGVVVIGASDTF